MEMDTPFSACPASGVESSSLLHIGEHTLFEFEDLCMVMDTPFYIACPASRVERIQNVKHKILSLKKKKKKKLAEIFCAFK